MNGHLRRCQSVLRAHVRTSTLRAQGLLPPCIWRIPEQAPRGFAPRSQRNINLNRLLGTCLNIQMLEPVQEGSDARRSEESPRSVLGRT